MVLNVLTLTGYHEIDFSLVYHLSYAKNIITIQGDSFKYMTRGSLSTWGKKLKGMFVSIDRNTMVNVLYIKSYDPESSTLQMPGGQEFKVSRRKQLDLRNAMSHLYHDIIPLNRIE
ncbi:LytTR family transcriptional regulator DNA-binding domain-containing protein [Halosquirtibacter xylanolyticus]|uniref:LytTR family DNA-binding domain-containing protein n=1 Tax=Halosquirtibacter xylanolyticus TaxID=3374599 RepID=UPI0037487BBA|nr:LytTR family transcriptional regulator DNA-binding domain-containing protein [Prolixibacteraceae bacterium]